MRGPTNSLESGDKFETIILASNYFRFVVTADVQFYDGSRVLQL